jgi:hypothetical protein
MPDFLADLNAFRVDLEASGLLPDEAFANVTANAVINLDAQGRVLEVKRLGAGKQLRELMPVLPRRTLNPVAAYLTGRMAYWGGAHRRLQRDLHERVLDGVGHPAAAAILAFLRTDPAPALPEAPLHAVLRIDDVYAHHVPELLQAWQRYFRPDPDPNPRIRVRPDEAFTRLGTAYPSRGSAGSYGHSGTLPEALFDPAGAARALNWLLDRPSTAQHQDHAVMAWLAGDPHSDPTPLVVPYRQHAPEPVQPFGTLHVAMLTARPPARVSLRWYWSGDAVTAFERLDRFEARLRSFVRPFSTDRRLRWHNVFRDDPRWADMVMAIVQALSLMHI